MSTPGLTFVTSRPKDPQSTSEELYNRFYNEEHLPDIVALMKRLDFPALALRYKNADPASTRIPYLALYPYPDTAWQKTPARTEFIESTRNSRVLGGDIYGAIEFGFRLYEKIQTFEGYGHEEKSGRERGQTIVCVAMEPGASEEQQADFEDWYRKQHLDMLSMCKGYRRTTRYRRTDGVKPRFLALHEYACEPEELPSEQIAQVSATEWTKKILAEAEVFERDVVRLVHVEGDEGVKL